MSRVTRVADLLVTVRDYLLYIVHCTLYTVVHCTPVSVKRGGGHTHGHTVTYSDTHGHIVTHSSTQTFSE